MGMFSFLPENTSLWLKYSTIFKIQIFTKLLKYLTVFSNIITAVGFRKESWLRTLIKFEKSVESSILIFFTLTNVQKTDFISPYFKQHLLVKACLTQWSKAKQHIDEVWKQIAWVQIPVPPLLVPTFGVCWH